MYELMEYVAKGAYGQVFQVIDKNTKSQYVVKIFKIDQQYKFEKENNILLQTRYEDLDKWAISAHCADDQNNKLYFKQGICSLLEFMQMRKKMKIYWYKNEKDIWYLLKKMVQIAFKLEQNQFYYSDYKPENFVLDLDIQFEKLHLKLIDFGTITNDFTQTLGYTPKYYIPASFQLSSHKFEFKDPQFRFWSELYNIGRTILFIMCYDFDDLFFKFNKNPNNFITNKNLIMNLQTSQSKYTQQILQYVSNLLKEEKEQNKSWIQNLLSENENYKFIDDSSEKLYQQILQEQIIKYTNLTSLSPNKLLQQIEYCLDLQLLQRARLASDYFITTVLTENNLKTQNYYNYSAEQMIIIIGFIVEQVYLKLELFEKAEQLLQIQIEIQNQFFIGTTNKIQHEIINSNQQLTMGNLYLEQGIFSKAEQCYIKCLELRRKSSTDHLEIASCLQNLGILYRLNGHFTKSEELLLESYKFCKILTSEDSIEYADSLANLGNLYNEWGNYEQSKQFYKLELEIREKLHPQSKQMADLLTNLAILIQKSNDHDQITKAEEYLNKSWGIYNKILQPNSLEIADCNINFANVYRLQKQYEKALDYQKKALEIRLQKLSKDSIKVGKSYMNIGALFILVGDFEFAEHFLLHSKEILEKNIISSSNPLADIYGNLSILYKKLYDSSNQNDDDSLIMSNFFKLKQQKILLEIANEQTNSKLYTFSTNPMLKEFQTTQKPNISNDDDNNNINEIQLQQNQKQHQHYESLQLSSQNCLKSPKTSKQKTQMVISSDQVIEDSDITMFQSIELIKKISVQSEKNFQDYLRKDNQEEILLQNKMITSLSLQLKIKGSQNKKNEN